MPTSTFENLKPEKKMRVTQALLKEFSNYPLNEAQVARIVKNAAIARGAFYKYFPNLTDAYRYLFEYALKQIHADFKTHPTQDAGFLLEKMDRFTAQSNSSSYFDLFKMHFAANEILLHPEVSTKNLSPNEWVIFTLSHETLREIFADYPHRKFYLQRFREVITRLKEE